MLNMRRTDSVRLTGQGIWQVRNYISDILRQENQQRSEQKSTVRYTREDFADNIGLGIDTLKRFLRGRRVRRDSAEAIIRRLGLELIDLIEPNYHQRPSNFYVERLPLEADCYDIIFSPSSALIRIKAPHGRGKTWFIEYLLNRGQEERYISVIVSFRDADRAVFADLSTFLKWFCANVGNSLGLPNQLEERWETYLGNNSNCINYFETYLLSNLDKPLVLVLDDVDLVFEQHDIAGDFCKLLRRWHDIAISVRDNNWRNLRLVIAHSTDIYGALDINHSPLAGVGTVRSLRAFHLKEVAELVQQYRVGLQSAQTQQMMNLIGGNPYLIHEALDYLVLYPEMPLDQFLHNAVTEISPYHNYLGEILSIFQQNSNLAITFKSIVNSTVPIRVESAAVFQLYGMGLVEVEEEGIVPSCELYRRYFRDRL